MNLDAPLANGRTRDRIIATIAAASHFFIAASEDTRWMSMSVVKSMTSTLIGAAIQDGYINSIDDPIVNYQPRFNGTAYDGVTVRHLLQMSSGVACPQPCAITRALVCFC